MNSSAPNDSSFISQSSSSSRKKKKTFDDYEIVVGQEIQQQTISDSQRKTQSKVQLVKEKRGKRDIFLMKIVIFTFSSAHL